MYENPLKAFSPGTQIPLGPKKVTSEEILEFANEFDPISFHTDEEAAKSSMLGGLSASGLHICCMAMRMMCDSYILKSTSQGAFGIDECKWLAPVKPGDTLKGTANIVSNRRSNSRPDILIVTFHYEFFNQNEEPVMEISNSAMFRIPEADNTLTEV